MPSQTIIVLSILALLAPAAAIAEYQLDVYGGYNITQDDDGADVRTSRFLVTDDAEFDGSPVGGLRIGGWLEGREFVGGALDVSFFQLDGEGGFSTAEVRMVPISALLMFRLSLLEDDSFSNGRLQPYLAAGPSALFSELKLDTQGTGSLRDSSIDIGGDARLGATWLFTPGLGMFLEYRFTYFEPRWEDVHRGISAQISPRLLTHHAQVGLALRF